MSLINVSLTKARLLVAVDTQGVDLASGRFLSLSKLFHLPHANVVMASRGTAGFAIGLFSLLALQPDADLDRMVCLMPSLIQATHASLLPNLPAGTSPAVLGNQEVVLAGWSGKADCMVAYYFKRDGARQEMTIDDIEEPGYVVPWDNAWGDAPPGNDRPSLAAIARLQVANIKRESPGTAVGGTLLIADLTRYGYSISAHCNLDAQQRAVETMHFSAEQMQALGGNTAHHTERLHAEAEVTA
jgi:hypothetical protein